MYYLIVMKKVFLGIKGHVVSLDEKTGKELWRSKLRTSTITNVVYDGSSLYAYCGGHIFSLNPDSGKVLWENELSGLGYGAGIIATENSKSDTQVQYAAAVNRSESSQRAAGSV